MSLSNLSSSNSNGAFLDYGEFRSGVYIQTSNQILYFTDENGNKVGYQWKGLLPHTTTTNDPNTDGGISDTAWCSIVGSGFIEKLSKEGIDLSWQAHLPTVEVSYNLPHKTLKIWEKGLNSTVNDYWLYTDDGTVWNGVGVLGDIPDVPFKQIVPQNNVIEWSSIATEGQNQFTVPYEFTNISVFINGLLQNKSTGGYVVNGSTVTLNGSLKAGDDIHVVISNVPTANIDYVTQDELLNYDYVTNNNLKSSSGASLVGTSNNGNVQQYLHDFNILSYGAKDNTIPGNDDFDNRKPIQDTIDAANARYLSTGVIQTVLVPEGVYKMSTVNLIPTGSSTAYGIVSLKLLSGINLVGNGTLTVFDNAYGAGAFYRIIGSDRGAAVSDVSIKGITLDGNSSNQISSVQCSNLVLEAANNILINGIRSINANGNGIMIRGIIGNPMTNVRIVNNYVYNCTSIGIQSSQFNGLVISGNTVDKTSNNCIDIYGDTNVSASKSNGVNFSIIGNTVRNSSIAGIFPETVANGTIVGNSIYNCPEGIHVNRIRSIPKNIIISSNSIYSSSVAGIWISGDMEGINIVGNSIFDFSNVAIQFGTSNGNVSNISMRNNLFIPSSSTNVVLKIIAIIASRIEVRNNTVRNNVGLNMGNIYQISASTVSGVNVDSWAITGSSLSNTGLEMYKNGTFTPTVFGQTTAGSATYTTQSGNYVRIGEIVHFSATIVYTGLTGTGVLMIGGLPFTPSTTSNQPLTNITHSGISMDAYGKRLNASAISNGLTISIISDGYAGAVTYPAASTYTSGTIRVSGFYFTT